MIALITSPAPAAMYTLAGAVNLTPVTGFTKPAGAMAHFTEPADAPTAIAITPASSAFMRNCMAIARPINNGMNDENSVKIADKSSAHCAVPNIFKMYFITADGKTPIKIPWAEPESTLKKKSFNFSSYEPSKNSLVIIFN